MRNNLLKSLALASLACAFFTACDDDDSKTVYVEVADGSYVLNTGGYGANNATLSIYDYTTNTNSDDVFQAKNGRILGDLAQDFCSYGSKRYITVSNSAKVEVIEKDGTSIKTINVTNGSTPASVRYMTAYNGMVYMTAYDGIVRGIDTTTLTITKEFNIGGYQEAITNVGGILYVNDSDYPYQQEWKTVRGINPVSGEVVKEIEVALNPYTCCKASADGNLFVISVGTWGYPTGGITVSPVLQRVNLSDNSVEELYPATDMTVNGNLVYSYYNNYADAVNFKVYNSATKQIVNDNFITTEVPVSPCSISVDPITGNVYVGEGSSRADGTVYVYDAQGNFIKKFNAGIYPKVFFATKTVEENL